MIRTSSLTNTYSSKCWYREHMPIPPEALIPIASISFETYQWKPQAPKMFSRAEVERQTGPYQAAVTATIADWVPRLSSEIYTDVEDATRQLIEFDKHAQQTLGTNNPAL